MKRKKSFGNKTKADRSPKEIKIYNIRVPESLHRALGFTAVHRKSSVVDLTREALGHYVRKHNIELQGEPAKHEERLTVQVRLHHQEYQFLEHIKATTGNKTPDIMRDIYTEYLVDHGYIRKDGAFTSLISSPLDPQSADSEKL